MTRTIVWVLIGAAAAGLALYALQPRPLLVETAPLVQGDIRAAVIDEATTILDRSYTVSMPVAGRLLRIDLQEGDHCDSGAVIARLDTFERRERVKTLESQVSEKRAMILGVDKAKPKPEDLRIAELAVEEAALRENATKKAGDIARINFEQEEKQHDRIRQLFEAGTVSQAEFDESQRKYLTLKSARDEAELEALVAATALDQARVRLTRLRESVDDNEYQRTVYEAQIRQLEAELAILRDELARCEIRAPVSGPILEKLREDQQVLPAGTPLLTIGDLASLRVEADILSEEIGPIVKGRPAVISGPAVGSRPLEGTVERVYPAGFKKVSSLGIEQQRVKVVVAFDHPAPHLRPGLHVEVTIITETRTQVPLVPERALFRLDGRWHCFAVRDGRARLAPVTVGLRNDQHAQIVEGLVSGDRVILSPSADLADGARVATSAGD